MASVILLGGGGTFNLNFASINQPGGLVPSSDAKNALNYSIQFYSIGFNSSACIKDSL